MTFVTIGWRDTVVPGERTRPACWRGRPARTNFVLRSTKMEGGAPARLWSASGHGRICALDHGDMSPRR